MTQVTPLNTADSRTNTHVDFESLQTGSVGSAKRCGAKARPGAYLRETYKSMIARCYRLNCKGYSNYGGRGIRVCDRWLESFEHFYADMGDRPNGFTLERVDVNGNYEPTNCRWADWFDQHNNRRNNVRLTYQGESLTISQWTRRLGLSRDQVVRLISLVAPDHGLAPHGYTCGCIVYLPPDTEAKCPAHGVWS